ncbi:MAG: DUF4139 domain-containing protein [Comamonas sp.]
MHPVLPALSLVCLTTLAAAAQAQDAPNASRITQVTVYPGSATVQRTLSVPVGARQAVFACLPAGLDAQTLQVNAPAGIAVGELSVRQQPRALIAGCAHPQQARIRALEDQIAALQAEAQGLEQAGGWLNRYTQPTGAAAQIAATADALRRTGQSVAQRQHQLTREQEALEAQLKPLQADAQRTGGAQGQASTVLVTLSAPQGGQLQLSYQVRGPGWQPGYRASLDVERQRVRLERTAQVSQNSGEDWRDVPLTLSTGQPNAAASGPLPRPWRIAEAQPVPPAPPMPAPVAAPMARMAKSAEVANLAAAPEAVSFDASVFEGSHATSFVLPQRVSVPSNGEQLSLALGEQQLDAKVLVRSTPALDTNAYLVASFALPDSGVWPSGPIRLYRDGAYVGASRLEADQVAQSGLGFGRDERVQVRALPAEQKQGTTGFIGSRQQRVVHSSWEVRNQHRTPIALQLLDAAPVAEQQDIRVESRYSPQPASTTWNEQPGSVLWELTLPPNATERISAEHRISWPQDMRLRERR